MLVSELLGKEVVDKNAMEVGKVSDIDLMPIEGTINSITISTGDTWLRNKEFQIKPSDIIQIGDYLLLNVEGEEMEETVEEEKDEKKKTSKKTRLTIKDD